MSSLRVTAFCAVLLSFFLMSCVTTETTVRDGTVWLLTAMSEDGKQKPIVQDARATLAFNGDAVFGKAGINTFRGPCTVKNGAYILGPFALTMMAGAPELLQFESEYLRLLENCNKIQIKDDSLIISNNAQKIELTFSKFSIQGSLWQLSGYNTGNAIVSDSLTQEASIELRTDATFGGTSGYNSFTGNYTLTPDSSAIKLSITGITRMLPPPEAAAFERALTALLEKAEQYATDGNTLRLSDKEGNTLLTFYLNTENF